MKVTEYLAPPMDVVLMRPYTLECTISKGLVACLPPCLKTQSYVVCLRCTLHKTIRLWSNKQGPYYSPYFEGFNTLHIQMAKATVPNLERAISCWRLHRIGRFCFVHLHKIDFIQIVFAWHNCNDFTIARFDNAFIKVDLDL